MKLKHVIYLITMNKFMLVVAGYEGEKKKKFNSFQKIIKNTAINIILNILNIQET